jgi:zinc transporter
MPASFGSALVLDGGGGVRSTAEIGESSAGSRDGNGPGLDEPALFLLDAGDPRTARWLVDNSALSDEERAVFLGPIQRTWAAILDGHDEPTLVLLLEAMARADERDADTPTPARLLLSARRLIAVVDLTASMPMLDRARQALKERRGPRTTISLFISLARGWTARYLTDVLALDRATAALEDRSSDPERREALASLHDLRSGANYLRRRAGSLRMAVHGIDNVAGFPPLLVEREAWAGVVREADELVELLDGINHRVQAIDDHFQRQLSAALSDRLYVLTLISAVLLPLSFVTGLLGVNIGGIPLRDSPWAFWLLCLLLGVIAVGQYILAKRMRWLPGQSSRFGRRGPR